MRLPIPQPLVLSAGLLGLAGLLHAESAKTSSAPDLSRHPGAAIYEKLCVECHGAQGEGVANKADDPLRGNRDLAWLASRIDRTMPEDQPELCDAEESRQVAEYIFRAFYSPEAQARLHPARISLARLTASQFRNSVTDLVGSFRGGHGRAWGAERGLKGFYDGTHRKKNDKDKPPAGDKFERRDPGIRFDFGEGMPPVPEGKAFSPEQFSIRWEGSVIAEETGVYEFVVRTRNGAMLWVNNPGQEGRQLIDAYVAPHNAWREESAQVFLLGGRAYPLKLDYFKYLEKAGGVELLWKAPHGVREPIPERCLIPERMPESFLVNASFPAEDRSTGYERGIQVSKAWQDAVTTAALQTGDYILDHLDELAGLRQADPDRARKLKDFTSRFVETGFRRPLSEGERQRFVQNPFQQAPSPELGVKRAVLLAISSPRFLYPALVDDGAPSPAYGVAARLALALWDSLPDRALQEAARKGELLDPVKLESHARKALENPRTREKTRGFFHEWLELNRGEDLSKDQKAFPGFDEAVLADLRTSLRLGLDDTVWGDKSDYRALLLSDSLFLNERLGRFYGKPVTGQGFQRVSFDPHQRCGVITHPFLLSTLAYHNSTSPIHRGVFLTRNIVGMTLKSPVQANKFDDAKFDPSLTMRQKVTQMTRSQACMGCHQTINPLGFSLENYDGVGRWRTEDKHKPVDPKSEFHPDSGVTIQLQGARDVAEFAAANPSAHAAFLHQLFHHLAKQPLEAYGPREAERLRAEFEKSGFNVKLLLARLAITASRVSAPPAVASR